MREAVLRGIAFIEDNLQNDIGVSDVTAAVSYSFFYFSREFSRHTHISVYDYIIRRKISESYKALFNERPRIVDLAFRFGFQSHEVYTRAFRKVFGENPSEALIYKPFAVYERIDGAYLDFLCGLRVEMINKDTEDRFFEVEGVTTVSEPAAVNGFSGDGFLALLRHSNLYDCSCIFQGSLSCTESKSLSFRLCSLRHLIRVHHTNTGLAFRFFFDYVYDAGEMESNYIAADCGNEQIDFYIKARPL